MSGLLRGNTAPKDRDLGPVIWAVRQDDLAPTEADRLASDGRYHPLVVDADGYLRVNLPSGSVEVSASPSVEAMMAEQNSLLRRVVLALEIMTGQGIPDQK